MSKFGTREVGFFGSASGGGTPPPTNPTLNDVLTNGATANRGMIFGLGDDVVIVGDNGTITTSDPLLVSENKSDGVGGVYGVGDDYIPYLRNYNDLNEESLKITPYNITYTNTSYGETVSLGIDNGTTNSIFNNQTIYIQNRNGALIPSIVPLVQITSTPYIVNTIDRYQNFYVPSFGNYDIYFDDLLPNSIVRIGIPPSDDKGLITLHADLGDVGLVYGQSVFNQTTNESGGLLTILKYGQDIYSSLRVNY